MKPTAQFGFTLIELVITVSIAAIVLAAAIPSFREIIQNNRITAQANELVTAFNLARSEAIKRGVRARACASTNGTGCAMGGGWQQGCNTLAS